MIKNVSSVLYMQYHRIGKNIMFYIWYANFRILLGKQYRHIYFSNCMSASHISVAGVHAIIFKVPWSSVRLSALIS